MIRRMCLAVGLVLAALLFLLTPEWGAASEVLGWLDPLLALPAALANLLARLTGLPHEFMMFPLLWIETTLLCCALAWLVRRLRR